MLIKIKNNKIIRFIFANDKPKIEKVISSHLVIGVFSRDILSDSISSKFSLKEEHPTL